MIENIPFDNPLPEINLALKAATQAATAVMKIYITDFTSELNNNSEPITEADIQSNQIIEKILYESGYPILSEESKDLIEKRLDANKVWIVDPLDGTTDFVNKTGEFTIMIALVEKNIPIMGVINHPSQKTIYVAQKGEGAYRISNGNSQILHVSETSNLEDFKVVGSRFHQSENERKFLGTLGISKFTSRGSSLKVIDICSKMAELYFTTTDKIKQWDSCASCCLITESGGKMTDMLGNELKYNTEILNHKNGLLVSNGTNHERIIEKYKEFSKIV